ncbi:unnamed protein product [Bubo scandiacus]
MCHPLLSPFFMATVVLCLQWAASSHVNSSGPGGLALAACLGLPLSKGKMAGGPALRHAHTASLALSPQCHRAEAPPAQRGAHKITTNSPGFGDVASGNGEIKRGPVVAFIMEVNMRLWRTTCQAEQRTIILLDECCFWNDVMWSFSHDACRCFTHNLDLLYYGLILPLCKVTSILVTMITGIKLLARCMKSYQSWREGKQQSKEWWPGSPPSMVWGAADYPEECAICLQVYEPGQALKLLSCSHAYHGKCIDLWHCAQPGTKTCPLCLYSVTAVHPNSLLANQDPPIHIPTSSVFHSPYEFKLQPMPLGKLEHRDGAHSRVCQAPTDPLSHSGMQRGTKPLRTHNSISHLLSSHFGWWLFQLSIL